MKQLVAAICMLGSLCHSAAAQTDLMGMLADSSGAAVQYTLPAFKGTRIVNGQSVQTIGKHNLDFVIMHRFDRINLGGYEFFGLDNAVIRLGLEYGLTDNVTIGIGRSSYFKTYDLFAKTRILKQTTDGSMPITLTGFYSVNLRTQRLIPPDKLSTSDKLTYTVQALLARRFNNKLSLQLSPTFIHRNRPELTTDKQGIWATGIGGRYLLTRRVSINPEYFYVIPGQISQQYANCFSLGFDIETGGHVFQLHATNSFGMTERYFISETTGSWGQGDIHFGFNILRSFALGKQKRKLKSW